MLWHEVEYFCKEKAINDTFSKKPLIVFRVQCDQ